MFLVCILHNAGARPKSRINLARHFLGLSQRHHFDSDGGGDLGAGGYLMTTALSSADRKPSATPSGSWSHLPLGQSLATDIIFIKSFLTSCYRVRREHHISSTHETTITTRKPENFLFNVTPQPSLANTSQTPVSHLQESPNRPNARPTVSASRIRTGPTVQGGNHNPA